MAGRISSGAARKRASWSGYWSSTSMPVPITLTVVSWPAIRMIEADECPEPGVVRWILAQQVLVDQLQRRRQRRELLQLLRRQGVMRVLHEPRVAQHAGRIVAWWGRGVPRTAGLASGPPALH